MTKLVRSATFIQGDGSKDFNTILKVCNCLARDGLIFSKRYLFFKKCKYEITINDEIVITAKPYKSILAKDTALFIKSELEKCFMNVDINEDRLYIKFDKNVDKKECIGLIKKSINKIIKY